MVWERDVRSTETATTVPHESVVSTLRTALGNEDEAARNRLLGELFAVMADAYRGGTTRNDEAEAQLSQLAKKTQDLEKREADLQDQLRTVQADLVHRTSQLEAEKKRAEELQTVNASQRSRIETMQAEATRLESELVNRNHDVHRIEQERESLQVKLQRAELASGDTGQCDNLEEDKRRLQADIAELTSRMEQLRKDKDEEIEALKADRTGLQQQTAHGGDALLASMWERLAAAKPAWVPDPGVNPTPQAAERLIDAFIELASFAHRIDQDMRPNLDGFTQSNDEIRKLWNVYKQQCDVAQSIRQTVAASGGKHVGGLKMALRVCRNWMFAALVSSDSSIEWLAEELRTHLLGPAGAGSNPKATIKDYIRDSGPEQFLENMRRLRGDKLADVYGRGA